MFGRLVKIDGKEIFVPCLPSTPIWQVLSRASAIEKARAALAKPEVE